MHTDRQNEVPAEDLVPICNTAAEWGPRQRFMQDARVGPLLGVPHETDLEVNVQSPASRVIWYPRFQEPGVLLLLTGVAWVETRYIISPALRSDARAGRCLPRIKPLSISSERVSRHQETLHLREDPLKDQPLLGRKKVLDGIKLIEDDLPELFSLLFRS